jgi:hypothetical protein
MYIYLFRVSGEPFNDINALVDLSYFVGPLSGEPKFAGSYPAEIDGLLSEHKSPEHNPWGAALSPD